MDIDHRNVNDIENRIRELARGYVPEWHYDPEHADIGAAIARIFALSMKENISLMNLAMDRFHVEFVNMLDLSLKAAKPAGSLVQFSLVEDTIPGTQIRKGTRLVAASDKTDSGQVIFETDRDIYVTNSRITDAFMTDREDGSFVPLLGDYAPVSFLEGEEDMTQEEEETGREEGEEEASSGPEPRYSNRSGKMRPFVLFSEVGNISKSALVFYHESLFDIEDEPIYIRLKGSEDIIDKIRNEKYVLKYYTASGFRNFDSVQIMDDGITVEVKKSGKCRHMIVGGRSYAVVVMEAEEIVRNAETLSELGLSSSGKERSADFVTDGSNDMNVEAFAPFTDTLSLYNECYIGNDLYFSKGGSKVTVSFQVGHRDRSLFLTRQEEEEELKIIKKKPKLIMSDIPSESYCDEISMEYYNGLGWRKLPTDTDVTGLLSGAGTGSISLSFYCPPDWARIQVGAYFGRAIRLRLLKADNCYLRPGIHHYPVIEHFRTAFTYEGHFVDPDRLYRVTGTEKQEITDLMKRGHGFVAMSGGAYQDDALYLGFSSRMENGPVSLYFELEDQLNMTAMKCRYEYSAGEGFKPLKIVDKTKDFSRSGSVIFMPPPDMQRLALEGKKKYWIRIRRSRVQDEKESSMFLPRIRRVLTNVVYVTNTVTEKETDFYLNDTTPNQRFSLGRHNILDAEVWVNEKKSIRMDEIERMLISQPDDIRVEYDMLGGVSAVYVKWSETSGFDTTDNPRSYVLDRMNGRLIFSDGIKAMMPRVMDDIAFKVRVRTSDGAAGNVDVGAINETVGTELYIDQVQNPVRAYGGSDMETVPEAFRRGANLLSSRGRLVSDKDYIYTILEYSDNIDAAACVTGETVDGRHKPQYLSFVLLMKDYLEGSFSFHRIAGPLKEYLLDHSPVTISPDHVFVVEPIFVSVSVSVWASVKDEEASFETQNEIIDMMKDYFNPVVHKGGSNWTIGVIPKKAQIMMKLGTLKNRAVIKKTVITVHYVDKDGEHTQDIDDVRVSPFMVVRSGDHKVYIEYE
ncbi:MAG: hypothetical protein IKN79_06230 [Eubacterium sp.]|nr:hypothetical protein [Eubacterium sp.]